MPTKFPSGCNTSSGGFAMSTDGLRHVIRYATKLNPISQFNSGRRGQAWQALARTAVLSRHDKTIRQVNRHSAAWPPVRPPIRPPARPPSRPPVHRDPHRAYTFAIMHCLLIHYGGTPPSNKCMILLKRYCGDDYLQTSERSLSLHPL